ncbi:hypothetical protein ANCCEY_14589, partial [Ancylostoma ceylanicum]
MSITAAAQLLTIQQKLRAAPDKEVPGPFKPPVHEDPTGAKPAAQEETPRHSSPEQPEDPKPSKPADKSTRAPTFVPVSEAEPTTPPTKRYSSTLRPPMSAAAYRLEVDSLNMLMNQVLEQMEKGPVSLNLVARVKAHPMYDSRPMVKELLESIMAAQPEKIQRETSKLVQQQSQDVARKQQVQQKGGFDATKVAGAAATKRAEKMARTGLGERPWVSVEVGFDPEEESEVEVGHQQSVASTATEVTVQSTSFEDSDVDQREADQKKTPTSNDLQMDRQTQTLKEEEEADSEDEEEYTDSEMEELADEVEQVEQKIVVEPAEPLPPPDPVVVQPQFLDAFDRGLAKRQSKGKYQHSRVDMYGRGVSTECESPTLPRKPLGGPQPTQEQSPFLFDKAKKIIMQYPGRPDLSEIEDGMIKKKKDWLKTQDPDQQGGSDASVTPTPSCVGSVPPRSPPPMDHEHEGEPHSEEVASQECSEEEEESEEESETEVENRVPRGPIIGSVRRDGGTLARQQKVSMMPYLAPLSSTTFALVITTKATDATTTDLYLLLDPTTQQCFEKNFVLPTSHLRITATFQRFLTFCNVQNQSWASEPRRFEVYKTRAERDAERNILAPSAAPSYRPASYYSSASDRPLTNFATRK